MSQGSMEDATSQATASIEELNVCLRSLEIAAKASQDRARAIVVRIWRELFRVYLRKRGGGVRPACASRTRGGGKEVAPSCRSGPAKAGAVGTTPERNAGVLEPGKGEERDEEEEEDEDEENESGENTATRELLLTDAEVRRRLELSEEEFLREARRKPVAALRSEMLAWEGYLHRLSVVDRGMSEALEQTRQFGAYALLGVGWEWASCPYEMKPISCP